MFGCRRRRLAGGTAVAVALTLAPAAAQAAPRAPPQRTGAAPVSAAQAAQRAAQLARSVDVTRAPSSSYAAGEVIVRFRDGASGSDRVDAVRALSGEALRAADLGSRSEVVRLRAGVSVPQAVARLNASDEVLYAEPNYLRFLQAMPNDPRFGSQWGLPKIGAPAAWDRAAGDPTSPVAVLDTGIHADHADLGLGAFAGMYDVINDDGYPDPVTDHGTHVAGIVGARANNGIGIAGLAHGSKVAMFGTFYWDRGAGGYVTDGDKLYRALPHIDWVGARVVNMSYGSDPITGPLLASGIEYEAIASRPNVLFVAAAGNESTNLGLPNTHVYPCSYDLPNVVCVAASTSADTIASFSNYDGTGPDVDLAAPGDEILSTIARSAYASWPGTSMAAPHVSAAAGIAFGMRPNMTAADVRWLLTETADQVPALSLHVPQGKRLNVGSMVALLANYPSWRAGPGPHPFVFKNGRWSTRYNYKTGPESFAFTFGTTGDVPLMGDWNGDGIKTPGVYRTGQFLLSDSIWTAPSIDRSFFYGNTGDEPIVGDWNGDGRDEVGVRRGGWYYLRSGTGTSDGTLTDFPYGDAQMRPIVGDWNGDGRDTVSTVSGRWFYIHNTNGPGIADYQFYYGDLGMTPVAGDWNRNGRDTIGMRSGSTFFLRNTNDAGVHDISFDFGPADGIPLSGG